MRSAYRHAVTSAVLLALANLTSELSAQDERSTHLVVKVIDPSGAPLAGAEVRIDRSTDFEHPVLLANTDGLFAADLRSGTYDLEVRSPGFGSYKEPLHVEQSPEQLVTVALRIGVCSPCVEVKAEAPSALEAEVPISSPPDSSLPAECRGQVNLKIGAPFFFSAEEGVRYGVSLEANHLFTSTPIPVHIWIENTTDKAVDLGSCSMFQGRDIDVWSNSEQRILNRRDLEAGRARPRAGLCSADIKISVPAHSCTAASKLYLNEMYSLPAGVYTVVERVQDRGTPTQKNGVDGLSFQVRDVRFDH